MQQKVLFIMKWASLQKKSEYIYAKIFLSDWPPVPQKITTIIMYRNKLECLSLQVASTLT